jgi:hypothetical protein
VALALVLALNTATFMLIGTLQARRASPPQTRAESEFAALS